jgi:hypothetical protein
MSRAKNINRVDSSFDLASSSTAAAAPDTKFRPGPQLKFVLISSLAIIMTIR